MAGVVSSVSQGVGAKNLPETWFYDSISSSQQFSMSRWNKVKGDGNRKHQAVVDILENLNYKNASAKEY